MLYGEKKPVRLYAKKYRVDTTRLTYWNYASQGTYLITLCLKDRKRRFGSVVNKQMYLTEIGKVAYREWYRTPEIRKDMGLRLGEFMIMPNHIHALITIGENPHNMLMEYEGPVEPVESTREEGVFEIKPFNRFGPQSKNLSSVMRGYKSAVTTYARKNQIPFDWQPGFYDRVIRSEKEFWAFTRYIRFNPRNWKEF